MKYGFAGDREISVKILELLINLNYRPSFLLVNESENATHTDKLIEVSQLDSSRIFTNKDLKSKDFIEKIKKTIKNHVFGLQIYFFTARHGFSVSDDDSGAVGNFLFYIGQNVLFGFGV